jgi:hypothetical protein
MYPPIPRVAPSALSQIEIVTLYDTGSDIHAAPAAIDPLVGLRRQGDAMATITYVTTPHNVLNFSVIYVWHLTETMTLNACPFKQSSLASAVAAQTASSKLPIFVVVVVRPSAARALPLGEGEEQASSDYGRNSEPFRAPTGADGRTPYEGRSRPPVTPHKKLHHCHTRSRNNILF